MPIAKASAAEPVKIKTRILRLNLFFKTLFFYKLFFSIYFLNKTINIIRLLIDQKYKFVSYK